MSLFLKTFGNDFAEMGYKICSEIKAPLLSVFLEPVGNGPFFFHSPCFIYSSDKLQDHWLRQMDKGGKSKVSTSQRELHPEKRHQTIDLNPSQTFHSPALTKKSVPFTSFSVIYLLDMNIISFLQRGCETISGDFPSLSSQTCIYYVHI